MRKFLLSLLVAASGAAQAQLVTFEELTLPKQDTFYLNYNQPGQDVGPTVGNVHFGCTYDTTWGGIWSGGFSYSNMTDTVDGSYLNQYAAQTGVGYNNTSNYAVYFDGYTQKHKVSLIGGAANLRMAGFYITNSTYAYQAMKNGNFASRKFGDTTGTNSGLAQGKYPDWFKLTIKGFKGGTMMNDSVEFYLADFRYNSDDSDYIVKDWQWLDLSKFGTGVDSIQFGFTSSDNHPIYGMNTPAYFCMDNFTVQNTTQVTTNNFVAKMYPNPATHTLNVLVDESQVKTIAVSDMTGKIILHQPVQGSLNVLQVAPLASGMYLLQISNGQQLATQKFYKN